MEQRRSKRFSLNLPVAITRVGSERITDAGTTRNISSSGVLFTSDRRLEIGGPIEYIVTLNDGLEYQVSIRCVGKVVRHESINLDNPDRPYAVAATMERYEFIRN